MNAGVILLLILPYHQYVSIYIFAFSSTIILKLLLFPSRLPSHVIVSHLVKNQKQK